MARKEEERNRGMTWSDLTITILESVRMAWISVFFSFFFFLTFMLFLASFLGIPLVSLAFCCKEESLHRYLVFISILDLFLDQKSSWRGDLVRAADIYRRWLRHLPSLWRDSRRVVSDVDTWKMALPVILDTAMAFSRNWTVQHSPRGD